MMPSFRIVFLGTPGFAVESLRAISDAGMNVVAVVTAPDKPAGRGMQLRPSPVKEFAVSRSIPVLQPTNLKSPAFLEELSSYKADIQVVIAFRMLPEAVWKMPPLGTLNLHASLLPDYRGAAPINHAIIQGEKITGVSTFFLKHEIDTGDLVSRASCEIGDDTTAGELHDQLMHLGADLMVRTLDNIRAGNFKTIPQGNESQKTAPKIFTETCRIDWNNSGEHIRNLVRGLSPYPGAFTLLDGKTLKIYKSVFIPDEHAGVTPGTLNTSENKYLRFACSDGWIEATDLQLEGKKRMPAPDFLIGYRRP